MTMPDSEHHVVLLFAAMSGSARLYERLEDDVVGRAVKGCIASVESAVGMFHGRLVQVGVEEVLALFDNPASACQAAMEMQRRVAGLSPLSGIRPTIRIGLHLSPTEGDEPSPEAMTTAARAVGFAGSEQILASRSFADRLPEPLKQHLHKLTPFPDGSELVEVRWNSPDTGGNPANTLKEAGSRLRLHYGERSFVLDGTEGSFSFGRDGSCDLIVEDRKASRRHGRIEKRGKDFVYLDRSTNGSYVSFAGKPEAMVRHGEVSLRGRGVICFGSSVNDPGAECVSFEAF